MKDNENTLHLLLVEDDPENLELLMKTLPSKIKGYNLSWDPCGDFKEALSRVNAHRYDVIVTDIYRDKRGQPKTHIEDQEARDIVKEIRGKRFCPIVTFTDGSRPESFKEGPFLKLADKTKGVNDDIIEKLTEVLDTGIPELARKLHDDLDRTTGSYLWNFLEDNWSQLKESGIGVLERLIRRRAAVQLGRLDPRVDAPTELPGVEGLEYYLYPSITGDELRLGEILKHKKTGEFRVVITPHCYLTRYEPEEPPRAEYVLTVKTILAEDFLKDHPCRGNETKKLNALRKSIRCPAERGKPRGRYCFLPRFLEIPDLYCDIQKLESAPHEDILKGYDRIAVLDTPFAEALQACLIRFYSSVGLPPLNPEHFKHLLQ